MVNKKNNFTSIRRPYKKYTHAKWTWEDVFTKINILKQDSNNHNIFILVSKEYGILYKTLVNKYNKYKNDNINININKESRGGSNKIFTNEKEQLIFNYLKINFIDKNEFLCDETIIVYALRQQLLWCPHKTFLGSNGWIYNFKKRWNLSTVRCSKSRIATKTYTEDDLNLFRNECKNEHIRVGSANFFNCDETQQHHVNASNTTIHIKGSDNAQIKINGNTKESITVTLIINANGDMLNQ